MIGGSTAKPRFIPHFTPKGDKVAQHFESYNTPEEALARIRIHSDALLGKSLDVLRNSAGKLSKGGPGSGCTGANCGRPSEGGSKDNVDRTRWNDEGERINTSTQQGMAEVERALRENKPTPKDITPTAQDEVTNAPRHHSAESNAKFKEEIANRQVGQTIMSQLGGNKFRVMTGAKDFVHEDKGVSFKIPKVKDGINHVKVVLTGADTYDVTFSKVRVDTGVKEVSSVKGIYNDQLQDIFREHTGLETHL